MACGKDPKAYPTKSNPVPMNGRQIYLSSEHPASYIEPRVYPLMTCSGWCNGSTDLPVKRKSGLSKRSKELRSKSQSDFNDCSAGAPLQGEIGRISKELRIYSWMAVPVGMTDHMTYPVKRESGRFKGSKELPVDGTSGRFNGSTSLPVNSIPTRQSQIWFQ